METVENARDIRALNDKIDGLESAERKLKAEVRYDACCVRWHAIRCMYKVNELSPFSWWISLNRPKMRPYSRRNCTKRRKSCKRATSDLRKLRSELYVMYSQESFVQSALLTVEIQQESYMVLEESHREFQGFFEPIVKDPTSRCFLDAILFRQQ